MFHGLLALLTRSLRLDARQLRNHLFRLSFVGFIYLSLLIATVSASSFGAPGLNFFKSIAFLNQVFITCAGIGFFASAITEEKEEDTIGLLVMAGLNPLGILLGKSTSRLIQASLLLIVQFPFMLLAVTLGGVTPHQIFAAYVALLAFLVLLANVALVFSTVCERGGSAAGMTALLLVLYAFAPLLAPAITSELIRVGLSQSAWYGRAVFKLLEWSEVSSVYWCIHWRILVTGFNEPIISTQVVTNFVGGLICFGIAWLLFIPSISRSSIAGRGTVLRPTSRLRLFSPGRAWSVPLAWKDFQFIAGGYSYIVLKVFAYALTLVGTVYLNYTWGGSGIQWGDVGTTYSMILLVAIGVEACVLAARIFHDEVRLQTLSSLLMLPRTIPYLAYTKALGCVMGLMPSIICFGLGTLLIPDVNFTNVMETLIDPFTWGIILGVTIFLHLVALLSLFVKWGALPLAVFVMAPISLCCPVWQLLFLVVGRNGVRDSMGSFAATVTVWILMSLVCFVFQMMIAARLQELGSK